MDVCRSAFIPSIVGRAQFFCVRDLGGGSKLGKWIVSLRATRLPVFADAGEFRFIIGEYVPQNTNSRLNHIKGKLYEYGESFKCD